jgi:predicted aconitase with swiveling domain
VTPGIEGRALVEGDASGTVLRLDEPLSFWGGLDPATGHIVDRRHPDFGTSVTGKILAMPSGRGSSSSSSVLAEAIRAGTGPAGIVMTVSDGIVALGAVVADELYGIVVPVMVVGREVFESIPMGANAVIRGPSLSWSSSGRPDP